MSQREVRNSSHVVNHAQKQSATQKLQQEVLKDGMTTPQKQIYKSVFNAYLTPNALNFLDQNGGDTKAVKALYSRKNK